MKRLSDSVDFLGLVVQRFAEHPLVHVTLTVAPAAIRLRCERAELAWTCA